MNTRKPPQHDDQLELFSAVFTDIVSRDAQDTLEHPFLSLSTKPRFEPIIYQGTNGVDVTVSGGKPFGIASIFDWDLMIWLMSQIRQACDQGESVSRKVRFSRYAYLKDVRRNQSGREYKNLARTIARLKNTVVVTNLRAKDKKTVMFNWLEYVEIEKDANGSPAYVTAILPEWLYEAICDHRLILNLHRDYFLLTSGLQRMLYRVIRKNAGNGSWEWKLRTLHQRSGSTRQYKYFARDLRNIIAKGQLLDYQLELTERNGQQFLRAKRQKASAKVAENHAIDKGKAEVRFLRLRGTTYEKAKAIAPRYDVYGIEQEWLDYTERKGTKINHPDKAFLAFCKSYIDKNPIPSW